MRPDRHVNSRFTMPETNVPRKIGRPPRPAMERFMELVKVDPVTGCWMWQGYINWCGYGRFRYQGRDYMAHRMAHILFIGPIPDGFDVDHKCHWWDKSCTSGDHCPHRACCNPLHLQAVSKKINSSMVRFSNALKSECPQGHPYTEENTYLYVHKGKNRQRMCRTCNRDRSRRLQAKKVAARSTC